MRINKILIFLSLAILILIPVSGVNAMSTYVGLQVVTASATGASNWCLPAGAPGDGNDSYIPYGTQMAVTTDASCSSATTGNNPANSVCQSCSGFCLPFVNSANPYDITYLASPVCSGGDTIWLGPLDLTVNRSYNIYLSTKTPTVNIVKFIFPFKDSL